MPDETKPVARVNRWRTSGRLMIQLATLAAVALNGMVVFARSTAEGVRRERRESREWVALYHGVMVNQHQQSWAPLRNDPSAALRSGDIWCAVKAADSTDRRLVGQLAD